MRGKTIGFIMFCMMMGVAVGLAPNAAHAQSSDTPPANTTIGNQASATYYDSGGNERTVTSNTVETTVQQVAAVSITPGITKEVTAGNQVSFPHTITNDGNGTDSFDITIPQSGAYTFDNISLYADANGDGVPDDLNTELTSTPDLASGEQFSFVMVADVPPSAANGESANIDLTATSTTDNSVSDSADPDDVAIITQGAAIDVIKSMYKTQGGEGETVTITLTFTNNGNADGTNLVLTDVLQSGFTYVDDSGLWSGSGTTLTDESGGDPAGIDYESTNGTITATIDQLAAGQQGNLTFDVTVDSGTGGQTITNTASYNHDDQTNEQNTNTTNFQVTNDYSVTVVAPDPVVVTEANQGTTVDFVNTFNNDGSASDRYNIEVDRDNADFPTGTTFTLYNSDGSGTAVNPLTDSNNDGIPDVGPVDAGENFEVILRVSLPANASGDNGGAGWTVDKTATSIGDPSQSAIHADQLDNIAPNSVDLTNVIPAQGDGSAPGEGVQAEGETNPVKSYSVAPGDSTAFTLFVNNSSGQSDNFDLSAGGSGDFSQPLPNGWSVAFLDQNGGQLTNTGSIAPGGSIEITAVVKTSPNAPPGAQSVYFRARSASSGATDVKHDEVVVISARSISLTSNQNGQIAPGGSIVYNHQLTNEGNVTENDGINSDLELQLTNSETNGFSALVYTDNNGDGQIDSGDQQITSAGNTAGLPDPIAPGEQVDLLVSVMAGNGVDGGITNTTTLTASPVNTGSDLNTAQVEDITTVVTGNVVIEKLQSADGSYSKGGFDVDPGDTIYYRIVVTNQGSKAVTDINIIDSTPAYTTMNGTVSVTGEGSPQIAGQPADGAAGTLQVSSTSLGAGASFTIEFEVTVDN